MHSVNWNLNIPVCFRNIRFSTTPLTKSIYNFKSHLTCLVLYPNYSDGRKKLSETLGAEFL